MEPKSISCLKKGERNLINTNNPLIQMNMRILPYFLSDECSHATHHEEYGKHIVPDSQYVSNGQKNADSEIDLIIKDLIPMYR